MRRWSLVALLLGVLAAPAGVAQAQQGTPNACAPLFAQTVLPMLQYANSYYPGGAGPYGYGPLAQPFGTNAPGYPPNGYPQLANFASYSTPYPPAGAGAVPAAAPAAMPPTAGAASAPATSPDPQLTADAVLAQLQSDGTWDRLSTLERADWMYRLAQLQQAEIGQQINQGQLQRQAEIDMVNIRRVPFDLAQSYQNAARNWHDSYVFAAQTALNALQASCNPITGTVPGAGASGNLGQFCATNPFAGGICSGFFR
jgi:hypothetical protein